MPVSSDEHARLARRVAALEAAMDRDRQARQYLVWWAIGAGLGLLLRAVRSGADD